MSPKTQDETGSILRLMLGIAQPTTLHMSASEAPLPNPKWLQCLKWSELSLLMGTVDFGLYKPGEWCSQSSGPSENLFGDSLPLLLTSEADKELFRLSDTLCSVQVRTGHNRDKAGFPGCLQVHHLFPEGSSGKLAL